MPETTLAGHPLHPQLVAFPLGLLPFSLAMDVMHLITGERRYADTAYHAMVAGCAGAVAAGAAGAVDYFSIPKGTKSSKTANVHGAMNLGLIGMYGLNLLLRSRERSPGPLPVALSALGTAGLIMSAWFGGKLVYDLGMRVKPVMEGDKEPQWKLPGDEKIEHAFEALEHAV
ncbi:MAG TPA: DUF2231 domain-containing protein [Gemmataceae bacterium]|nr:DUF2231 domain-containing protein [Gemmataceae bacterium]